MSQVCSFERLKRGRQLPYDPPKPVAGEGLGRQDRCQRGAGSLIPDFPGPFIVPAKVDQLRKIFVLQAPKRGVGPSSRLNAVSKPSEKRQLAGFFLAYAKQLGVFLFSFQSLEKSPASNPVNFRRGKNFAGQPCAAGDAFGIADLVLMAVWADKRSSVGAFGRSLHFSFRDLRGCDVCRYRMMDRRTNIHQRKSAGLPFGDLVLANHLSGVAQT